MVFSLRWTDVATTMRGVGSSGRRLPRAAVRAFSRKCSASAPEPTEPIREMFHLLQQFPEVEGDQGGEALGHWSHRLTRDGGGTHTPRKTAWLDARLLAAEEGEQSALAAAFGRLDQMLGVRGAAGRPWTQSGVPVVCGGESAVDLAESEHAGWGVSHADEALMSAADEALMEEMWGPELGQRVEGWGTESAAWALDAFDGVEGTCEALPDFWELDPHGTGARRGTTLRPNTAFQQVTPQAAPTAAPAAAPTAAPTAAPATAPATAPVGGGSSTAAFEQAIAEAAPATTLAAASVGDVSSAPAAAPPATAPVGNTKKTAAAKKVAAGRATFAWPSVGDEISLEGKSWAAPGMVARVTAVETNQTDAGEA